MWYSVCLWIFIRKKNNGNNIPTNYKVVDVESGTLWKRFKLIQDLIGVFTFDLAYMDVWQVGMNSAPCSQY